MATKQSVVRPFFYKRSVLGFGQETVEQSYISFVNQRTGASLPGWKRIIKAGSNATTAMNATRATGRCVPGSCSTYWTVPSTQSNPNGIQFERVRGQVILPENISPGSASYAPDAVNQASSRFYADLRAETTSFQGGVWLGELRETIGLLRRPGQGLFRGLQNYLGAVERRKRPKRGKRWNNRMVQDTWLEYSFGWTPLLSDVKDLAMTAARLQAETRRSTFRGYGTQETLLSSGTSLCVHGSTLYGFLDTVYKLKTEVIYKAGTRIDLQSALGSTQRLIELSGFSLENWAPTVYELIPYSWVVDYFSNLGDVLACSCTSTSHLTWKKANQIDTYTKTVSHRFDPVRSKAASPTYLSGGGSLGYARSEGRFVTRSVPVLGIPTLQLSMPGFSTKWLNLAALIGGSNPFKNAF